MDLINDDKFNLLNEHALSSFSGNDIPLLWGGNNYLGLFDLAFT